MKPIYFAKTSIDRNERTRFKSRLKALFIAIALIPLVWSCEFLNYNELDQYDENFIFNDITQTKNVLTYIYSYLPVDFSSIDGAMRESASDNSEHVWDISDIQKFNDGSWNAIVTVDPEWSRMYTAIRTANVFIENTKESTFPEIQYNDNYKDLMTAFRVYPYEARFLRAFYYFELIKRYGNVPLITTRMTSEEANAVSQSSFDEIVQFIVTECDSAITKLPFSYATSNFISGETGRATKGAAMALKARVLLYAASPLHNTANDLTKWVAAATASKAIIDQLGHLGNNTYSPLPAYTAAVNSLTSKELILERREAASRSFETNNTAVGFYGGNTGASPTQNLVDSYEMQATGLGINEPGSGYNASNPYATSGTAKRDPRLAMSILYNGAVWKNPNIVQTFYGGLNGPPTANTTKTGYYIKKYMIEGISLGPSNPTTSTHYWVIFRYGEVLLNYAEAMNEAYGPEVFGTAPLNNLTARAAVNIVRARTGVAMPAFPLGMSQSAFRDKLRNERRVELAFEDHRFWDIRRWMIGGETKTIRGVDITRDSETNVLTYTPKIVETRVWDDKMYLYPIPQTEMYINKNLVQNPGW